MAFVLDASVALAWCFTDEVSPLSERLLDQLATKGETAIVPTIWHLEMGNILVLAERHKRFTYAELMRCLELLESFPIVIDEDTSSKAFHEIASLAYSEKITTYDAAYLELAIRLGIPLATQDKGLRQAAKRLGITLL